MDQEKLDAMARQNGFKSWQQMHDWYNRTRQPVLAKNASTTSLPTNVNDAVNTGMSWHPAWILNYVNEQLKNALGGN